MKHIILSIALPVLSLVLFAACMDDHDEPNTDNYKVTRDSKPGDSLIVNYSIAQLKTDYANTFSETQGRTQITEDKVIEGVVAANDCGGNLYQTLLIRKIDSLNYNANDVLRDQAIVLGVKSTWLTPYFPLGQRVRINLKNLYIGCYSKLPKIGQPYTTSSGNVRLGPIFFQLCATNVELVGKADASQPECKPLEPTYSWLRASANRTYLNFPQLVTVKGTISEADGKAIFAPDDLKDAGYGVDRTLVLSNGSSSSTNNTKVTIRTSTQNDVSFTVMPTGEHTYTGMLSYYNSWQIQLRSTQDIDYVYPY